MDARLQRRVQRYGWDKAARHYEALWRAQLAPAQAESLALAALGAGQRVLDMACGTGLVTLAAAQAVGPRGAVVGVDLSEGMVRAAQRRAQEAGVANASFARMDAEELALPDACFDAALCALGLMYMPQPERALAEMRRVLRGGGRVSLAVWGERAHCGWAEVFSIVDAEVASEVCPLFFRLGQRDTLARLCAALGFEAIEERRLSTTLVYTSDEEACDAVFVGGPVALAWSRFDEEAAARARRHYLESIARFRDGRGYRVPGEFVVVSACVPNCRGSGSGSR